MPDLTTTYLGLTLKTPLVPSASPLSRRVETVRQLEAAGAGAVVVYSLFEEQITHESFELDHYLDLGAHSYAECMSYFPDFETYNVGPERYLDHIRRLKDAVNIPVIASLNGVSAGGWVEYARRMEEAGADAVELNIYYLPADPDLSAEELETTYAHLVRQVAGEVTIPVAVKLSPFFTALPHVARRLAHEGARGLVLFNRFYQPDLDIESLRVVPNLELSTSHELRLPLRWIAMLHGRVPVDLALTSGVHSAGDVVKAVMSGASVAMLASELLAHGVGRLSEIAADFERWLDEHEYDSVAQMRGSMSQRAVAEPAAFERANYLRVLDTYEEPRP
jgi:dihydroorotate dehydrogenase (fumarate)